MVADMTIHCAVVDTPAETTRMNNADRARFRPSDLVPWADPYIASLVHKLQREVREEQLAKAAVAAPSPLDAWDPWDWDGEQSQRVQFSRQAGRR
jgi:hypothetical protein